MLSLVLQRITSQMEIKPNGLIPGAHVGLSFSVVVEVNPAEKTWNMTRFLLKFNCLDVSL